MGRGPQVNSRDSIPSVQNFLTIHRFLDTSFNKALGNVQMRDIVEIFTFETYLTLQLRQVCHLHELHPSVLIPYGLHLAAPEGISVENSGSKEYYLRNEADMVCARRDIVGVRSSLE